MLSLPPFATEVTSAARGCEQAAEVENLMTSVERIRVYGALSSEEDVARLAAKDRHLSAAPPPDWPTRGEVVFEGLCLRYRPVPRAVQPLPRVPAYFYRELRREYTGSGTNDFTFHGYHKAGAAGGAVGRLADARGRAAGGGGRPHRRRQV